MWKKDFRLAKPKVGIAPDGRKYPKIDAEAEYPLLRLRLPNPPAIGVQKNLSADR